MNPTAQQIQKINHYTKEELESCAKIASAVEIVECGPKEQLLKEGDTGDTMVLVFQGQVEVSKDMMVKTPSGSTTSRKPIIRLETTDPKPLTSTTPLSVTLSSVALKIGTIAPIGIVELPKVDLSVRKLVRTFLDILSFD